MTIDAVRFHVPSLLAPFDGRSLDIQLEGILVLALAGAWATAVALGLRCCARDLLAQRARVRSLRELGTTVVDGREIVVVRGAAAVAFCAGLLRPRILVSQGALRLLSATELRAVVAHEAHHADRRDPLRLLACRALSAPFRAIPVVGALDRRHAVLAELAADAAAVRSLGSAAPLAGALLAFDADQHGGVAGVTPERVDRLLGELAPERVPPALLAGGALGLAALAGLAVLLSTLPEHPELPLGAAPLCLAAVYAIAAAVR